MLWRKTLQVTLHERLGGRGRWVKRTGGHSTVLYKFYRRRQHDRGQVEEWPPILARHSSLELFWTISWIIKTYCDRISRRLKEVCVLLVPVLCNNATSTWFGNGEELETEMAFKI